VKVIDVHIHTGHLFQWSSQAIKLWMESGIYKEKIFNNKGYLIAEKFIKTLEEEGISGGILLPEYSPLTAGVLPVEDTVEISKKYQNFIPAGAVNPNVHLNLLKEFQRQLKLGVKLLKLHPVHGLFYINDKRLYPLYEFCQDKNIVVMMHAGTSIFPGTKLRYADPYTFDDVATDFPKLKIILCHGGRGFWYQIAEFMVYRHENVYIDISGLPPKNLLKYYPRMEKLSDKFLFGSDFPGVPSLKENIKIINNLELSLASREKIFYKNAEKLFGFNN